MKEGRTYLKVTLTERGSRRQESRHPWVYDNEVGNADEGIKDGDLEFPGLTIDRFDDI